MPMIQPNISTDTATAGKYSSFDLSERFDFHMVVNPSIAVYAHVSSLSVDETLLPRYMNWPISFRSLAFNIEIAQR